MHSTHEAACAVGSVRDIALGMSRHKRDYTNDESIGVEHFQAFLAVVETGSQKQAATRLRSQQPTISRRLKRVQNHFGGGLFEAGLSGPLSTRGALVEQALRAVMTELTHTRDRLLLDHPVLRIGFIRPMRALLERALRERIKVPGIPTFDVRLLEMNAELLARACSPRARHRHLI
jgi:DNA-binding transcriptional LysR family regulator